MDQRRAGGAPHIREAPHLPAGAADEVGADDLAHGPVAPLDQNVRSHRPDDPGRVRVVEDQDEVHGGQGRQHLGPFRARDHWPAGPLELPDGRVAVHRHHQEVAQGPGFGLVLDEGLVQRYRVS